MKIALTSRAVPQWDHRTLAARAAALRYDAIELTHPVAEDPAALRETFQTAGVVVACLATGISMPPRRRERPRAADDLRSAIDAAAGLGCGCLSLAAPSVPAGQTVGAVAAEMGEWLPAVADLAAERGVTLLIENALHCRRARDLWSLLEAVNHPAVAAAWNLAEATRAGESPAVSVPTLNLRIQYVRVRLSEGGEPVEDFVRRLKGVGYGGHVAVDDPPGVSEEVLADAVVKLRAWGAPQAGGKGGKAAGSGTVKH
jgi:sugar phosphate isomerase/epimerase